MSLKNLFTLVVILMIGISQAKRLDGQNAGGALSKNKNMTYLVKLISTINGYFCSGSLIAPNKVLTSASCVNPYSPKTLTAVGDFENNGAVKRKVIHIAAAPEFGIDVPFAHDYAVVTLESPLVGNNIKTIRLCTKPAPAGTKALAASWSAKASSTRKAVSIGVTILSKDKCFKKYPSIEGYPQSLFDEKTMICASESDNEDECNTTHTPMTGDSIVVNGELHGISSIGWGCQTAYYDMCALRKNINALLAKA